MKRLYVAIVAAALVAFGASAVFAFGPGFGHGPGSGYGCAPQAGFGPGHHGPGFGPGMAQALNLSKEQMDKMFELQGRSFNEMRGLRYDLFQKRLEARGMYTDPKVDEATIAAKQKEINSLQQKVRDRMAQLKLEQRRILTPEQLKKLHDLQASGGFGRGFGPGHGMRMHRG